MRSLLVVSTAALSLILFAPGANAGGGVYQRTKDGKALVWNNYPLPGDAATWSGDRDLDGYATGYGTLTWARTEQKIVTGSNVPVAKHIAVTRYSGMMIQGKLDGPVVNVDANGKTFHGTFVDGRKTKDWVAGPAPSPSSTDIVANQPRSESVERDAAVDAPAEEPSPSSSSPRTGITSDQVRNKRVDRETVVEVPAEGPSPSPNPKPLNERVERAEEHISAPAIVITQTPPQVADDSLRSLTGPPALLRKNPGTEPSPQTSMPPITSSPSPAVARPRLTAGQVIDLADTEARAQGYELGEYQHPQARYIAADGTWSVLYDPKSVDSNAMGEVANPFAVNVEDKTKKTAIAPEK